MRTSRIPKFYNLSIDERLRIVSEFAGLSEEEARLIRDTGNLGDQTADMMIENVIGGITYPLAVAVNFMINGREYIVPMALEEPSVVAAASNAARVMRRDGGIQSRASEPIMIGQIQVMGVPKPYYAKMLVLEHKEEIMRIANERDPTLVSLGGGVKDVEARVVETAIGPMLIVHLLVDVRDAMGANAVNTMCESVAPYIEELTGGKVYLRIVSNLADRRVVRSRVKVYKEDIGGEEVVDGIVAAWAFADADPYRAATHNKGILNGVIAVALATAQDHRAIEAGAHAYASRTGRYRPLSTWEKDEDGNLVGTLEMPMPVGIVGGATRVHPVARVALKILGVKSAKELAEVMGAVGLAQNFAALRALATEGIQRGHMKLHARNLAVMAGARGELINKVAEIMIKEGRISYDNAKRILEELTTGKK
ncbi:hydroxymethylglutaryl-CoA reductase, degradative [Candidatus Geothermarchaeota archaeon ex4572_27]|nr:MAG: hydroxymethylglutaryl-CoA reductase, degradative [Candidatus Geothermarchaeota archaeon ex4572_27]